MSHPPSTPVKVPASAAAYTPATLDPELRSQINTVMLREGHITKIQEQLLHSLDAHPANWPSAVQTHALTLLRSGEASTFPALIRRVLEDVRHDTAMASRTTATTETAANGTTTTAENGESTNGAVVNGNNTKKAANGVGVGGEQQQGLAVPAAVLETVLKLARESLEQVCSLDEAAGGATNGG